MERANEAVKKLESYCERPFITPSLGVLKRLEAIGKPRRLGILTPYFGPAGEMVEALVQAIWKEQRREDEITLFSNVNGLSGSLPGLL